MKVVADFISAKISHIFSIDNDHSKGNRLGDVKDICISNGSPLGVENALSTIWHHSSYVKKVWRYCCVGMWLQSENQPGPGIELKWLVKLFDDIKKASFFLLTLCRWCTVFNRGGKQNFNSPGKRHDPLAVLSSPYWIKSSPDQDCDFCLVAPSRLTSHVWRTFYFLFVTQI